MYNKYSKVCYHSNVRRIDNDFVRCIDCNQSVINKLSNITNKKSTDFTSTNRHFNRNFSNELPPLDQIAPGYLEYYADIHGVNRIIVDRTNRYFGTPVTYNVTINDEKIVLDDDKINHLLALSKANRIKN